MVRITVSKLDETCNLATFLNTCLKQINSAKMFTAPRTFDKIKEEEGSSSIYCQILLFEDYAKSLIDKLNQIIALIDEYKVVFLSKWKYYALSKRLESIKEGWGSEDDYNEDGEPITENIPNDKLEPYLIVHELYDDSWADIVEATKPADLSGIALMINANARLYVTDMFRDVTGKTILPYKTDKDGRILQMTSEEVAMQKALDMVKAKDISTALYLLCEVVQYLYYKIKNLDKFADNEAELSNVQDIAKLILKYDIDKIILSTEFKEYYESHCTEQDKKDF